MSGFVILSQQKPNMGEPCNGCGFCCQNEACQLSVDYIGSSVAPCVALEWDGVSRYECGLVLHPLRYVRQGDRIVPDDLLGPMFRHMLGVGRGCDSGSKDRGRQG